MEDQEGSNEGSGRCGSVGDSKNWEDFPSSLLLPFSSDLLPRSSFSSSPCLGCGKRESCALPLLGYVEACKDLDFQRNWFFSLVFPASVFVVWCTHHESREKSFFLSLFHTELPDPGSAAPGEASSSHRFMNQPWRLAGEAGDLISDALSTVSQQKSVKRQHSKWNVHQRLMGASLVIYITSIFRVSGVDYVSPDHVFFERISHTIGTSLHLLLDVGVLQRFLPQLPKK